MTMPKNKRSAHAGFLNLHVRPRWRELISDSGLLWCVGLAAIVFVSLEAFAPSLPGAAPKMSDIASFLVAYSGITFGGCIAGATLAVALPGGRALAVLAVNGDDKVGRTFDVDSSSGRLVAVHFTDGSPVTAGEFPAKFRSRYLSLVFIFVYSAFVQLVLTLVAFIAAVTFGSTALYGEGSTLSALIGFSLLSFFVFYAVQQLMACLNALLNFSAIRDVSIRDAAVDGDTGKLDP